MNNPFMFSFSGQLKASEIMWSVIRIASFGALLILGALLYASHVLQNIKLKEQKALMHSQILYTSPDSE